MIADEVATKWGKVCRTTSDLAIIQLLNPLLEVAPATHPVPANVAHYLLLPVLAYYATTVGNDQVYARLDEAGRSLQYYR